MRLVQTFDPIAVGEVDTFAFDFTRDAGDASLVASQWTCRTTDYSKTDLQAVQRVRPAAGGSGAQTSLRYRAPDGSLQVRTGSFGVALVGPMPASMAGATYVLDCVALFSDGRRVALSSTVTCVLPGQ